MSCRSPWIGRAGRRGPAPSARARAPSRAPPRCPRCGTRSHRPRSARAAGNPLAPPDTIEPRANHAADRELQPRAYRGGRRGAQPRRDRAPEPGAAQLVEEGRALAGDRGPGGSPRRASGAARRRLRVLGPPPARSVGGRGSRETRGKGRGTAHRGSRGAVRGARVPRSRGRRGGTASDLLIAALVVAAAALLAPAQATADENLANEPPFGGELPPPLVRPHSQRRPPRGFELSGREAARIAGRTEAVRDERVESPGIRAIAFERGDDWQVSYFTGSGPSRTEVAQAIVDGTTGRVLGSWHDHQLSAPLARGYSGAIAQKVNAPYVWLPLCLLFCAPFIDPRRPFRLLHLDLLVLLGLGVSLFFFNRAQITASVALTYPVLGYFL